MKPSLLLLLALHLVLPCQSSVTKENRDFTDEQVQERCKFSLQEIHDCKMSGCSKGTAECGSGDESTVCQFAACIGEKTKCEKPLNQFLTPEEICEGDAFDQVDLECLKNSRKSFNELAACKGNGYARARKQCFQSVYKQRIETIAKKQLDRPKIPDRVIDCALEGCYHKTEECLQPFHLKYAENPAAWRTFDLELCAYVTKGFPHECEVMDCTVEVEACGKQNRNLIEEDGPNVGLIAGIVVGLLVAVIAVACAALFIKKRIQSRSGSPNGRGSPVQFSQVATSVTA